MSIVLMDDKGSSEKVTGALALIFGLLILIGSVGMFLLASATVNDYQSTAGQLARGLDPEQEENYEQALAMQICCGVGIVIGLILTIVGAYLYFKQPQQQQPYRPQYPQPYYQPPRQQYQQPYYQPPPPSDYRPPRQP